MGFLILRKKGSFFLPWVMWTKLISLGFRVRGREDLASQAGAQIYGKFCQPYRTQLSGASDQ